MNSLSVPKNEFGKQNRKYAHCHVPCWRGDIGPWPSMYLNEAVFTLEACVCSCHEQSPNTASIALHGVLVLR